MGMKSVDVVLGDRTVASYLIRWPDDDAEPSEQSLGDVARQFAFDAQLLPSKDDEAASVVIRRWLAPGEV